VTYALPRIADIIQDMHSIVFERYKNYIYQGIKFGCCQIFSLN